MVVTHAKDGEDGRHTNLRPIGILLENDVHHHASRCVHRFGSDTKDRIIDDITASEVVMNTLPLHLGTPCYAPSAS